MSVTLTAHDIARTLGKASRSGKGWKCCCPAHEDKNPSFFVMDHRAGGIWVKCHAGCDFAAVRSALQSRQLWPERGSPPERQRTYSTEIQPTKHGRWRGRPTEILSPVPPDAPPIPWDSFQEQGPTHKHKYLDEEGRLLMVVARWDRLDGQKDIRPITLTLRPDGRLEWTMTGLPAPRPLYGLQELAARPSDPVLVVEGEKTAEAGRKLFPDHVVVTWPGGANAVSQVDWSPLSGRDVKLWPDNDEPGRKAMAEVAALIAKGNAR